MESNNPSQDPLDPEISGAFSEGRLATIEAVLMLMWNEHPHRAAIKRNAITFLASAEVAEEQDAATNPLLEARKMGREHSIAAIFHEMPRGPASDSAHKP